MSAIVEFQCALSIIGAHFRNNVMDSMSNYQVWMAGTMLVSVCARDGKGGVYENMGKCSRSDDFGKAHLLKPSHSLYREGWKVMDRAG